jgi:trigger factor
MTEHRMQTQVRDLEEACRKQVSIKVEADQVEKQFKQSFYELRNTITLPGFRRGKVPVSMLQKRFGKEIAEDVKRDLVMEGIQEAVKEHELNLVADPDFDFGAMELVRGEDFSFEVTAEVKPEFDLPDYKGIKVTRTVDTIGDENVDSVIEDLRNKRAVLAPVEDGVAAKDDQLVGRLEVRAGEEILLEREQDGCTAGDADKLAQIPFEGLGDILIGKKIGDSLSCSSTVPEDYPVQDMKGKDVELHFTINEIKRLTVPEADEEFVKSFGFDDMAALREKIEADLKEHAEARADQAVEEAIIDDILGRVDFPVPPTVLASTVRNQMQNEMQRALYSGQIDTSDFEGWMDAKKAEIEPEAARSIRAWYLIQKIAKKEKIFSTESDLEERIVEIARSEGQTPTQVREYFQKNDGIEDLRTGILEQKVRKFLQSKADITEGAAS